MIDNRNFMYTLERVKEKGTVWRCRLVNQFRCKAKATTNDNQILEFSNEHNHDPQA